MKPTRASRLGAELLALLYETPLSGDWSPMLESVAARLGTAFATLVTVDRTTGAAALNASSDVPEESVRSYDEYFAGLDPTIPLATSRPVGEWLSTAQLPELPWRGTEYFEDFITKAGIEHVAGLTIVNDEAGFVSLALNHQRGRPTDEASDRRFCGELALHLRRAVEIQARVAAAESQRRAAVEALDRLEIGVVLMSPRGRVVAANRAAEAISASNDGLTLSRSGLVATRPGDTGRIRELVEQAARTSQLEGGRPGGLLRADRRSGKRPYEILVTPVSARRLGVGRGEAGALVFVSDPEARPRTVAEHLIRLYDLTPAEAALAIALLTGASLAEIADGRGVSIHTVRAQLKSVLAKAGAHRQTDLVRLLQRSVAMFAG